MRNFRLMMFLYGIAFVSAGSMTLFILDDPLYPLLFTIGGVVMATYAYVYAEFQKGAE